MNPDRSTPLVALGLAATITATVAILMLLSVPLIDDNPAAPTTTITVPLAPLP